MFESSFINKIQLEKTATHLRRAVMLKKTKPVLTGLQISRYPLLRV